MVYFAPMQGDMNEWNHITQTFAVLTVLLLKTKALTNHFSKVRTESLLYTMICQ